MSSRRQRSRKPRGSSSAVRAKESSGPTVPGQMNRTVKQSGKVLLQISTSSNVVDQALNPTIDSRLTALAATFQLYRFVWLKFVLHPAGNRDTDVAVPAAGQLAWILGFTPDDPENNTVALASFQAVSQMPFSSYMSSFTSIPQYFTVPRNQLTAKNSSKWWETDADVANDRQDINQGHIYVRSEVAELPITVTVEYEIEFTNPLPAALTLARVDRAIREQLSLPESVPSKPEIVSQIPKTIVSARDRGPERFSQLHL